MQKEEKLAIDICYVLLYNNIITSLATYTTYGYELRVLWAVYLTPLL